MRAIPAGQVIEISNAEPPNLRQIPFEHIIQPANKGMNAVISTHSFTYQDLSSVGTHTNKIVVADLQHWTEISVFILAPSKLCLCQSFQIHKQVC